MSLLLYPILPAVIVGTLNWMYWRKKGYTAVTQLVMNILVFYALFYVIIKLFY
jgi:uncharacterized membrane protein